MKSVSTELKEHWLSQIEGGWLAEHNMAELNIKIVSYLSRIEVDPEWQDQVTYLLSERAKEEEALHSARVARDRLERNDWKRFLLTCQLHGMWLASEGGSATAYEIRDQLISD